MKVKIVIPSVDKISRKGNGQIFVQSEEDKKKVIEIVRKIDEEEFALYMPEDFVKVFNPDCNWLGYTGKFDIDVPNLVNECMKQDIYIVVFSCNEYNYDDSLTFEKAIERQNGMSYKSDFVYAKTKCW